MKKTDAKWCEIENKKNMQIFYLIDYIFVEGLLHRSTVGGLSE